MPLNAVDLKVEARLAIGLAKMLRQLESQIKNPEDRAVVLRVEAWADKVGSLR